MFEKYYTPEQMEYLKERAIAVGEERIRQVELEWQELIAEIRAEMELGTDPTSDRVKGLARRSIQLVQEFTGGNPEIQKSLNTMYQQEGAATASRGAFDSEVFEYLCKAQAALNQ